MERKEIEIEIEVEELGIVFPCPYCGEWNYMEINELKDKTKVLFKCSKGSCGKEFTIKLTWPEKEVRNDNK